MNKKVLVLGSLNVDLRVEVDHFPRPGETCIANKSSESFGGKGANQAVALAKLGTQTHFLGFVGADAQGEQALNFLKENGVRVDDVRRSGKVTGKAIIYVDKTGENEIVVIPGANFEASVEWINEQETLFQENKYLVLQAELPIEAVERAIELGHQHGMVIVFNPAPAVKIRENLYPKIDILILNEQEAMDVSKINNVELAAKHFIELGTSYVIISQGDKGALGATVDGLINVGANMVEVRDTTGAGDCFVAALTWAFIEGKSFKEILGVANKIASLSVTKEGTMSSYPTYQELVDLGII